MERRTIPELVTLYELEPSIRDIYVEGPTDRAFLTGLLERVGYREIEVWEIDEIEVSEGQLRTLNLGTGSRQRIIALALMLEQSASVNLQPQVICIADADDEAGCAPHITGSLLVYTDVSSMPVYAYDGRYIQWYLDVVVLGFPIPGSHVVAALNPVLMHSASARRALKSLCIDCSLVDLTRDCTTDGHSISFDDRRFIERLVNKANAHGRREQLDEEAARHRSSMKADPKLWVHAEDFSLLLHWLIVRLRGSANHVAQHLLCRTLLLGIPVEDLRGWPLFQTIFARFPLSTPFA